MINMNNVNEKETECINMECKKMASKHYNRMKGFLRYDIEERDIDEQKVILEATIKVAQDMLKAIETK